MTFVSDEVRLPRGQKPKRKELLELLRAQLDGLPLPSQAGAYQVVLEVEPVASCRRCGCTDAHGCAEGCSWVEADLCSSCARPARGTRRR